MEKAFGRGPATVLRIVVAVALVSASLVATASLVGASVTATPTTGAELCTALQDPAVTEIVLSDIHTYDLGSTTCFVAAGSADGLTVRAALGTNPEVKGSIQFQWVDGLNWTGVDMTKSASGCGAGAVECPPLLTFTAGDGFVVSQSELADCDCDALIRVEHDWTNGNRVPTNWILAYNYLHDTLPNDPNGHGDGIEIAGRAGHPAYGLIEGNVIVNMPQGAGVRIDGDAYHGAEAVLVRNNTIVHRRSQEAPGGNQAPVTLAGNIKHLQLHENVLSSERIDVDASNCTNNVAVLGDGFTQAKNYVFIDENVIRGVPTCPDTQTASVYNTKYFWKGPGTTASWPINKQDYPGTSGLAHRRNACDPVAHSGNAHRCGDGLNSNNVNEQTWQELNDAMNWKDGSPELVDGSIDPTRSCSEFTLDDPTIEPGAPGFTDCAQLTPNGPVDDPVQIPCQVGSSQAIPSGSVDTSELNPPKWGYMQELCAQVIPTPTTTTTTSSTSTSTSTSSTTSTSTSTSSTSTSTSTTTSTTTTTGPSTTTTTIPATPGVYKATITPDGGSTPATPDEFPNFCVLLASLQEGDTVEVWGDHSTPWPVDNGLLSVGATVLDKLPNDNESVVIAARSATSTT